MQNFGIWGLMEGGVKIVRQNPQKHIFTPFHIKWAIKRHYISFAGVDTTVNVVPCYLYRCDVLRPRC